MSSRRMSCFSAAKTIVRSGLLSAALFATPHARAEAPTVRPEVIATFPHDHEAFTQGLLVHDGKLYESTGLQGRSTIRRVVQETGVVEKSVALSSEAFGEGLALVGERFFQLTWQNHVAFTYDLELYQNGRFDYTGEGWGLCYDGQRLVMSDGSSKLFFRNPETFAVTGEVEVKGSNGPIRNLNELECVGSLVYANVWQTNTILRIDPASGDVLHVIDAAGLLTPEEMQTTDVLNGIAFDPKTSHFLLTGKLWPKLFEVRFPFDPGSNSGAGGSGTTDAGTGGTGTSGESGGSGESDGTPTKPARSRSDCGCELPGASADGRGLIALVGLVLLGRRRRATRSDHA